MPLKYIGTNKACRDRSANVTHFLQIPIIVFGENHIFKLKHILWRKEIMKVDVKKTQR